MASQTLSKVRANYLKAQVRRKDPRSSCDTVTKGRGVFGALKTEQVGAEDGQQYQNHCDRNQPETLSRLLRQHPSVGEY